MFENGTKLSEQNKLETQNCPSLLCVQVFEIMTAVSIQIADLVGELQAVKGEIDQTVAKIKTLVKKVSFNVY